MERGQDGFKTQRLSVDSILALKFYRNPCSGWHTFKRDRQTMAALMPLARAGMIQINGFSQARATKANGSAWNPRPQKTNGAIGTCVRARL